MANEKHLKILKQGVEIWNRWREDNSDVQPDLSGVGLRLAKLQAANLDRVNLRKANLARAYLIEAHLSKADLTEAILHGARLHRVNFSGANLSGAKLNGAKLNEANLSEANLSRAKLNEANFTGAHLVDANLSEADLSRADFSRTNLSGADFTRAEIAYTMFGAVDLRVAKGLDTVRHKGPSTIGADTIQLSNGIIPEVFLRGAGVSDPFITYISSLTSEANQYYSCFISYSSHDEVFAQRLHADLQQQGVRCWFAPEHMKIGYPIRKTIYQSIRRHDKLLVILSENSMQSDWVEDEVETAIEEEKKRKESVLFPIRLDEAVMDTAQAWAAKLRRTRHIGDFSFWKDHDAYQQAFERLLRDLKAEEEA